MVIEIVIFFETRKTPAEDYADDASPDVCR